MNSGTICDRALVDLCLDANEFVWALIDYLYAQWRVATARTAQDLSRHVT